MSEDTKKKEKEVRVGIKLGKDSGTEAEEVAEILGIVSEKIPALIKGLVGSVFSPDAASSMGKAAAAYYKELKQGGLPEEVAVKMTQDYIGAFTKVGDMFKGIGEHTKKSGDVDQEIRKAILEKVKRKLESED